MFTGPLVLWGILVIVRFGFGMGRSEQRKDHMQSDQGLLVLLIFH